MKYHYEHMARIWAQEQEHRIRTLLGMWVSEVEPVIVFSDMVVRHKEYMIVVSGGAYGVTAEGHTKAYVEVEEWK